ncbi:hypothetical protein SK128_001336 [Halocaridina rubra]|uniref:Uncharacterized protein n=1 Tax=Halocaridina rubra TaxID=373956 RepID=A0AAN9A6L6_HALRR
MASQHSDDEPRNRCCIRRFFRCFMRALRNGANYIMRSNMYIAFVFILCSLGIALLGCCKSNREANLDRNVDNFSNCTDHLLSNTLPDASPHCLGDVNNYSVPYINGNPANGFLTMAELSILDDCANGLNNHVPYRYRQARRGQIYDMQSHLLQSYYRFRQRMAVCNSIFDVGQVRHVQGAINWPPVNVTIQNPISVLQNSLDTVSLNTGTTTVELHGNPQRNLSSEVEYTVCFKDEEIKLNTSDAPKKYQRSEKSNQTTNTAAIRNSDFVYIPQEQDEYMAVFPYISQHEKCALSETASSSVQDQYYPSVDHNVEYEQMLDRIRNEASLAYQSQQSHRSGGVGNIDEQKSLEEFYTSVKVDQYVYIHDKNCPKNISNPQKLEILHDFDSACALPRERHNPEYDARPQQLQSCTSVDLNTMYAEVLRGIRNLTNLPYQSPEGNELPAAVPVFESQDDEPFLQPSAETGAIPKTRTKTENPQDSEYNQQSTQETPSKGKYKLHKSFESDRHENYDRLPVIEVVSRDSELFTISPENPYMRQYDFRGENESIRPQVQENSLLRHYMSLANSEQDHRLSSSIQCTHPHDQYSGSNHSTQIRVNPYTFRQPTSQNELPPRKAWEIHSDLLLDSDDTNEDSDDDDAVVILEGSTTPEGSDDTL